MLQTEFLRSRLEDAYGAESALMDVMETQLADLTGQQEMESKYLQFLDQTHRHANMLQDCVMRLHGGTSSLDKGGMATFINTMKDLWTRPVSSRLVKHDMIDFAAIHYEMAQLNALVVAARTIGDAETAGACAEILREKREMVEWLGRHLPQLVHQLTSTVKGGEDTSEEKHREVDMAGTLQKRRLYAVVDDEQKAQEVGQALQGAGVEAVDVLQGRQEAEVLSREAHGPTSLAGKATRLVKGASGETQLAEHYATHIENGRIVLCMPCPDRATADKLIAIVKEHGGYDLAYVGDSMVESIE